MKTRLCLAILMAATLCATSQAHAQEVRYDFTGTYASMTPTTALTAPGATFTFEFLVPESVTVLGTPPYVSVNAPILSGSYTFGGSTASVSSGTYFSSVITYGASTSIDLNASVGAIHLGLSEVGPFVTLPPDASHQSHFLTGDLGTKILGVDFTPTSGGPSTIGYAEVSVVGTPVPVPEPSSVGFLAVGLLSCGGVAFLRHRRVR